MVDMNRCPQTEDEMRDYFYALIGRSLDGNANDWYQVMLLRYNWKGQLLSIPRGVGPGIQQAPDAPFFGLTQQMGSAGNPQARVFLPATKDENGYYTKSMQYIKDTPGGVHGTDFQWAWFLQGPNTTYVPVTSAGGGTQPPTEPPPTSDLEKRVETLEQRNKAQEAQILQLITRVEALEQTPPSSGLTMAELLAVLGRTHAEGRTNTTTYHSHQAKLPLVVGS